MVMSIMRYYNMSSAHGTRIQATTISMAAIDNSKLRLVNKTLEVNLIEIITDKQRFLRLHKMCINMIWLWDNKSEQVVE